MTVYRPRTAASALKAQLKAATRSQRSYQPPAGGGTVITSVTALGGVLTGTLPNPGFSASALASLGIARGQATLTWSGNAYSNQVVITHDLGAVPTYIGAGDTETGGPYLCAAEAINWTATQAAIQAAFVNGAIWTGTKVFCWLAML